MRASLGADLVANMADPLQRAVAANDLVRSLTEAYVSEIAEAVRLRAEAVTAARSEGASLSAIGRAMTPPVSRQRAFQMASQ